MLIEYMKFEFIVKFYLIVVRIIITFLTNYEILNIYGSTVYSFFLLSIYKMVAFLRMFEFADVPFRLKRFH